MLIYPSSIISLNSVENRGRAFGGSVDDRFRGTLAFVGAGGGMPRDGDRHAAPLYDTQSPRGANHGLGSIHAGERDGGDSGTHLPGTSKRISSVQEGRDLR